LRPDDGKDRKNRQDHNPVKNRSTNITYAPSTSKAFPWNVGLYDSSLCEDEGYTESVGTATYDEAIEVSKAWIDGDEEKMHAILVFGLPKPKSVWFDWEGDD